MATAKINIVIKNLKGKGDVGVEKFEFHVDAEYSTEEVLAYIAAIPEIIATLTEKLG